MKHKVILSILIIILVFTAGLFFYTNSYSKTTTAPKICFQKNCFYLELATTRAQQTLGLMNRTSLPNNKGMLFIYQEPGIYSFWMKNTLIPLDMIWLDENFNIIYIKKNAQPCLTNQCPSYGPQEKAKYVLELNAGEVEKINLKIADQLTIY